MLMTEEPPARPKTTVPEHSSADEALGVETVVVPERCRWAVEIVVVNVDNRFSAYRNECAHEALPLDNAILDAANGTITCPWHGFCYDASSGECLSAPGAQLEQLPLRVDDGDVWVRVRG